jgi:hypothetical protein
VSAGDVLYRCGDGSLQVREAWFGGLSIETQLGGVSTTINLDVFQARDFLLALCPGRRFSWPIGPAER